MKHSESTSTAQARTAWAGVLMWALPLLLVVPNIALGFTEHLYSTPARIANVLLPLGLYTLICALWKRIGITALLALPLMILCSFQIVLLYLYGQSIIAVDMFLNVVTTNVSEATELLANLTPAIITVCALYLPPLALGIVLVCRGRVTSPGQRRAALVAGGAVLAAGIVAVGASVAAGKGYDTRRLLFPANVCSNMGTAVERTIATDRYFSTSAPFAFNARKTAGTPDNEIIVLVIGETSRACNWQLAGYPRLTNPRLSRRNDLTFFRRTLSESNTTHKSVPLMLSHLDSYSFGDSIYSVKGVVDAFGEAGFATAWISNQERNGALIDFFGEQASSVLFLTDDGRHHHDIETTGPLKAFVDSNPGNVFAAVHTYGSHFNYRDRIPEGFGLYFPDNASEAAAENRTQLVNAYDNSIIYTDMVLDSIMDILEATGRPAALLYLADHGEDIFDDARGRFLHASPIPTYYQLHVPLLVWTSSAYRSARPATVHNLQANTMARVSSSRSAFHTLLDLAGVTSPCYRPECSVASERYRAATPIYLNDYNEAVSLQEAGLRPEDFRQLERAGMPSLELPRLEAGLPPRAFQPE